VPPLVFADCEPAAASSRAETIAVLLVLLAAYLAAFWFAVVRGPRWSALGVYLTTAIAGAVVILTPGGLSDVNGDYGARFAVGMLIAAGVGLVAVTVGRAGVRVFIAALLGGGAFAGGGLFLFLFLLEASGSCLD
jgi:hypothetical protein